VTLAVAKFTEVLSMLGWFNETVKAAVLVWPLMTGSLTDMSLIEIVTGPSSSRDGADRVAGALQTRCAPETFVKETENMFIRFDDRVATDCNIDREGAIEGIRRNRERNIIELEKTTLPGRRMRPFPNTQAIGGMTVSGARRACR
jgi:hypothetical protein